MLSSGSDCSLSWLTQVAHVILWIHSYMHQMPLPSSLADSIVTVAGGNTAEGDDFDRSLLLVQHY